MISRRGMVAFLLLAALGAYAWYDWRSGRERDQAEALERRLFPYEAEEVHTLRLGGSGEEILLRRAGGEWAIQEPVTTPADAAAVDRLISSLLRTKIEKRLDAVDDPGELGLTGPGTEVEIAAGEGEAERRRRVRIGAEHPFRGEFYARLGGEEIVLLSSEIGQARDKDLMALRDRRLIELQSWQMKSLEIERGEEAYRLVREEGDWRLESPIRTPAAAGTVSDLLSHLGRLEAISFAEEMPEDLGRYGLDQPRLRLTLLQEDWTEPRRIDFGIETGSGNRYVRRWDRNPVMEVESAIWPKLNQSLAEWRSPDLFLVKRWSLAALERIDAEGSFRIEKDEAGDWRTGEGTPVTDRTLVEGLLDALEALQAVGYPDDAGADLGRFGLDAPRARILAWKEPAPEGEAAAQQAPDLEILIGSGSPETVHLKLAGWPAVYDVPAGQVREVEEGFLALRRPPAEPAAPEGDAEPE